MKTTAIFLKSIALILFISINCNPLFSQYIIDIDENTQNKLMNFPIKNANFAESEKSQSITKIEIDKQIPSYSLYDEKWDTLYLRADKLTIPFFENQLKINLVQDNNTPFAFPTAGFLTIGYVKNKNKQQHVGLDYFVSENDPIVACFDGVVRIAKYYEDYGNTVVVRHYNGLETVYAHLKSVAVVTNQILTAGKVIGFAGKSGNVKTEILHFELRFLNEVFSPEKMISLSDRKLFSNSLLLKPEDFMNIPVILPEMKQEVIELPKVVEIIPDVIPDKSAVEQIKETPATVPVFHTVQSGETIYRICMKYKISEDQFRKLNTIKGDRIDIGQRVRVK